MSLVTRYTRSHSHQAGLQSVPGRAITIVGSARRGASLARLAVEQRGLVVQLLRLLQFLGPGPLNG